MLHDRIVSNTFPLAPGLFLWVGPKTSYLLPSQATRKRQRTVANKLRNWMHLHVFFMVQILSFFFSFSELLPDQSFYRTTYHFLGFLFRGFPAAVLIDRDIADPVRQGHYKLLPIPISCGRFIVVHSELAQLSYSTDTV